jgi:SAM-dependent methyltransferase
MSENIYGQLPSFKSIPDEQFSNVSTLDIAKELYYRLNTKNKEDLTSNDLITLLSKLQNQLDHKLDVFNNRFSFKWLQGLFYGNYLYWQKYDIPIANATYIDMGCGAINPFGFMFLLLMLGAKKCICVEPDPLQDPVYILQNMAKIFPKILTNSERIIGNYRITKEEIINNIASFDLESLEKGEWKGVDSNRLIYLQESITNNTISNNEADVIITNSVIEHLPDLDAAFKELSRITKKGGYGIHNIDGLDHYSYGNPDISPLEFLTIDTEETIIHLSNRIRPLSCVEIFERNGFEVLDIRSYGKINVSEELRNTFVSPFSSMSQELLEVTQAYFLVRKL